MKQALFTTMILFMSVICKSQVNHTEDKTNFFVAGFTAGYNKYPVAGLQFGYRISDFYVSISQFIPVTSDALAPKIFGGSFGYNIGSLQGFISYSLQTIGREREQYFKGTPDEFSNGFRIGGGLSYYLKNVPLNFTLQRTGKQTIFSTTLYKTL